MQKSASSLRFAKVKVEIEEHRGIQGVSPCVDRRSDRSTNFTGIRPGLGIAIVPDSMRERLIQDDKGLIIASVHESGSAAQAGLKGMLQDQFGRIYLGDVILSVDGQEVNSLDDIYQVLDKKKIGDSVEVKYRREGKIRSVSVKLKAL